MVGDERVEPLLRRQAVLGLRPTVEAAEPVDPLLLAFGDQVEVVLEPRS